MLEIHFLSKTTEKKAKFAFLHVLSIVPLPPPAANWLWGPMPCLGWARGKNHVFAPVSSLMDEQQGVGPLGPCYQSVEGGGAARKARIKELPPFMLHISAAVSVSPYEFHFTHRKTQAFVFFS